MTATVERALRHWGLEGAPHRLIAARENAVYRVDGPSGPAALRLHRKGYRTDAELRSELDWMAAVARAGVSVPAPIPTADGALMIRTGGFQIDLLTWLDGEEMTAALAAADEPDRARLFHALGREMARLHDACEGWTPQPGFSRASWDRDGLLGDMPLWDRFWDSPALTAAERVRALAFRDYAAERLTEIGPTLDYGLIHADLVPANVLVEGEALRLIDFDDGGYGWRLFDVATALLKHCAAPDCTRLRRSLIAGYRQVRKLDDAELPLFLALRAATYVGWNIARMAEAGGAARNARFIAEFFDALDALDL